MVEVNDGCVLLRLNRPEKRNAIDLATWHELAAAVTRWGSDRACRAIVITGGDLAFSAGGDRDSLATQSHGLMSAVERLSVAHDVLRQLEAVGVPVIAAVERYAIGTAWGLVLACDLTVAGEEAFFQAPFAHRGLVADTGTGWQLVRRLGYPRAMRYLLQGERMSAELAYELGLISHLAPDGAVAAEALRIAGTLACGPSESNALTKSLARQANQLSLSQYLDVERVAFALGTYGDDAREGLAAFAQRREPKF